MKICLIAAVDQGNSIGLSDGSLPWHISWDLARFKDLTLGHSVLMGRKTFESLKMPLGLPNRDNFILTKNEVNDGIKTVTSLSRSIQSVKNFKDALNAADPEKTLWVIGGARVFAEAISTKIVDEIQLTQVHRLSGAEVTLQFNLYDYELFIKTQKELGVVWELVSVDHKNNANEVFSFVHLKKIEVKTKNKKLK